MNRKYTAAWTLFIVAPWFALPSFAESDTSDNLAKYERFWDAEKDSKEQAAAFDELREVLPDEPAGFAQSVRALHSELMRKRLGEDVIQAMGRYGKAPANSDEEREAEAEMNAGLASRNVSLEEASRLHVTRVTLEQMTNDAAQSPTSDVLSAVSGSDEKRDLVGPHAEDGSSGFHPEVAITLNLSRDRVIAGEPWSVFAIVENRSNDPVWVVNRYTTLSLSPELWGMSSQTGSMGAFFPTVVHELGINDEIARVNAGAQYTVIWKVDPFSEYFPDPFGDRDEKHESGIAIWSASSQAVRRVALAVSNYLFFVPGSYRLSANVNVWPVPPAVKRGTVMNLGHATTVSVQHQIQVDASIWVLILGASLGGLFAFTLQSLESSRRRASRWRFFLSSKYILGAIAAILLASIGTILLSRITTSQFIIAVDVRDFWGAVATGFVIQWIGFSMIAKLLPDRESGERENSVDDRLPDYAKETQ